MSESKKPELFKKGSAIFVSNSHLVNHPNSFVNFYFILFCFGDITKFLRIFVVLIKTLVLLILLR